MHTSQLDSDDLRATAATLSEPIAGLWDRAPIGLVEVDAMARLTGANATFARLLGLEPGCVPGSAFLDHIDDDLTDEVRSELLAVISGEASQCHAHLRWLRSDGTTIWAALNLWRLGPEGGAAGIVQTVDDARSLGRQLAHSLKMEEAGRLAAGIAHEVGAQLAQSLRQTIPLHNLGPAGSPGSDAATAAGHTAETDGSPGETFASRVAQQLGVNIAHAHKHEEVGRLAAGIAHEINTPIQFVSDNVHFVEGAIRDLLGLVGRYEEIARTALVPAADTATIGIVTPVDAEQRDQLLRALAQAGADADIEFLRDELPNAISETLEGIRRVSAIVKAMKAFGHPDASERTAYDLNFAIENTLTVARNEIKYVAEIETHFDDIPPVVCCPGDINQVLLNILVNGAQAIGEERERRPAAEDGSRGLGRIVVTTRAEGESVLVSIEDNGGGIPDHVAERVFEPFFTTKGVGSGTGQGLAIAYSLVVHRHGGRLWFESVPGTGTTFFLRLPINGPLEVAR